MTGRVKLFAFIVVVPIVAFLVAAGTQNHMNLRLREAVRFQYPDADPARIASLSVEAFKGEADPNLRSAYHTYAILDAMKTASVIAGGIGLLLLLAIWIAGRRAAHNRQLLLSLFRPGLYLTAAILIGLVVVYGALATMSIYYGESVIAERVHYGIIFAVAVGGLVGAVTVGRSIFTAVGDAQIFVVGKALSRTQAPKLWSRVDEVARRTGAEGPTNIVVGLDPNFFVTEADVACLDGAMPGRTMYCSLPLARVMTVGEFDAVAGHELGHFKGLDTQFSQKFYPIYRGTVTSLESLRENTTGWRSIAAMPAIAILSYFLECFSLAETRIGRDRELAADKEGAAVTDSRTIATALVKIHAFSPAWESLCDAAVRALKEGKALTNVSGAFAGLASGAADAKILDDIAGRSLSHPTDSHPPLGIRLDSLGIGLSDVSTDALAVNPASPAIEMISEYETMEQDISAAFQALLARRLGIDLEDSAA